MRGLGLALVLVAALTIVLGIGGLPPRLDPEGPVHTHVGARYAERGLEETGLRNLVAAVLLVYRGFDTFLEVVVIFTALVAVLALPSGVIGGTSWLEPDAGAPEPDAGRLRPDSEAPEPDAGRPGPGDRRAAAVVDRPDTGVPVSNVVGFVVRLLAPFIAVFAAALLYRGHVTPGGGFQAAAIFGALFIALGLVLGRAKADRLVPRGVRPYLQAMGPLAFALVGLLGWRLTGAFLGYPSEASAYVLREAMVVAVEVGIAVGGAVILARLFQALEGR